MLKDIIVSNEAVETIKNQIYSQLCSIVNFEGTQQSLIEKVTQKLTNCINPDLGDEDLEYVRIKNDLKQEYKGKTVKGIILDTTHRIIRTPSVIVDSLLGQGEALDCYNMKLQEAATLNASLENQKLEQAIKVIDSIDDPMEKAKLYKRVFGDCCDVPQSGCGCWGEKNSGDV